MKRQNLRRKSHRRGPAAVAVGVVVALVATLAATPTVWAEFAAGGTGTQRGSIDWFEWGAIGDDIPLAGTTVMNSRMIGGVALETTCTIGAIAGSGVEVYRSGDSSSDGLDDLYNSGANGAGNEILSGLTNITNGGTSSFPVSCSATLGGSSVLIAGLVVASAETNAIGEYVRATSASGQWRMIDRHRDPSCTENPTITVDTPAPGERRISIGGTAACATSPTAVAFAEGASGATVEIHGAGQTAVALGVMLFSDFGDAPASYGEAGAIYIPSFDGPILGDGSHLLFDLGLSTTIAPAASMLGTTITPEGAPQPSDGANLDAGDDSLVAANSIRVTPGVVVTRTVSCKASTFVAAWLDWDRNGAFDADERTATTTCASDLATLSWTTPADAVAGASYLRIRAARTAATIASPTGIAPRGEVEDYSVHLLGATPFVTCTTDPEIFNTGYNSATGGVLTDGAPDSYWSVAGGAEGFYGPNGTTPPASTSLPPGHPGWMPAEVGKINPAWSNSPYPTANYISADFVFGTNQVTPQADWYFRYQFDLDPMVDLDSFRLDMRWLADNSVAGIWVNDIPQTGTNLPQSTTNPYHYQGYLIANAADTRLDSDWQAGLNTIIVQMKSSNLAEGFLAVVDSTAVCIEPKSLTIDKVTDVTDMPADGDAVTYTVTVTNSGPGDYTIDEPAMMSDDLSDVLDDATFGSILAPASGAAYSAGVVTWSGPLAAGESIDIVYTVIYDADAGGDHVLLNTACVPVDDAPSKPEACASTQNPAPDLEIAKSVDPTSGSAVRAGDVLTYTLTYTNVGATPAIINGRDDLSGVLDDADLGTIIADPGLTAIVNGTDLEITGTVPVGPTPLTVAYTATVRPFDEQGDHVLINLMLCPIGAPDSCSTVTTENPVAYITPTKTTDRPEGSTVYAGSTIEYALTFTNDGAAPESIHAVDDLSDVLDDADLVAGPNVEVPKSGISILQVGDSFIISGVLDPGETITVVYLVRVRPDGERGNDLVKNTLVADESEPISTEHPVGILATGKTVVDADATTLGDEVLWTITGEIPNEPVTAFVITDLLDARLDYASTEVTLTGPGCPALVGDEFDVLGPAVGDAGLVTVTFTDPVGLAVLTANPDCDVTVVITTGANAVGEIPNEALIYPNQGTIDTDTPIVTSPVETRWGGFSLQKVDSDGDPLVGAQFSIYPDLASAQAGGAGLQLGGETAFEVTSPSGELTLSGLRYSDFADGAAVGAGDPEYRTYYLVEVRAPDGHELLAEPIPVIINATSTAPGVDVLVVDPASNAGYILPPAGGHATAAWLTGLGIVGMLWTLIIVGWLSRRRLIRS